MKFYCGGPLAVMFLLGEGALAGPFQPLFRRQNATVVSSLAAGNTAGAAGAGEQYTTSTALTTAIYTVTSCAPDVTNCPAGGAANQTSAISTPNGGVLTTTVTIFPSDTTAGSLTAEQTPQATSTALGVGGGSNTTSAALGTESVTAEQAPSATPTALAPAGAFNGSSTSVALSSYPTVTGGVTAQAPGPSAGNETGSATNLGGVASASGGASSSSVLATRPPVSENTTATAAANNPGVLGTGGLSGAATTGPSITAPAPFINGSQTTLTVAATTVNTIISCAPSITSCPGASETEAISSLGPEAVQTVRTTSTIAIYTTICPVTAASSLSSSILTSMSDALTTASYNGQTSVYLPSTATASTTDAASTGAASTDAESSAQMTVVTQVPTVITTTISGVQTTFSSSIPVTTQINSPVGQDGGAGSGSSSFNGTNGAGLGGSSYNGSSGAGSAGYGSAPGASTVLTSLVPSQSVVTVTVNGSPSVSTSSTLLTSTLTVPTGTQVFETITSTGPGGAVVTETIASSVANVGGGGGAGTLGGSGGTTLGSSATLLVPTQSVVTVTVSGGVESLSTSSALATQTVFVTATDGAVGGQQPAQTVTVTASNGAVGGQQPAETVTMTQAAVTVTETAQGGQCQASTVTVCPTSGVCPTGALKI